jgi:peptidoglycan/LPS O-acetylase OafA/YrhL
MTGYIRGLDGLRAIAILWVMLGHVLPASKWNVTTNYHKVFELLASAGWVGVQLFFVISGFLITKILLGGKGQEKQLSNFYMRRSLRIFPVYYFTLFVLFIALPLMGFTLSWLSAETENQLWFWVYLNNWIRPFIDNKGFSHLWSLAIEEQYYLVWPFIVIFLDKKWLIRICLGMIISAPIFRFLLFYYYAPDTDVGARAAYDFTFARWDAIALGSLLAVIVSNAVYLKWLQKYYLKILAVSLFLIFLELGIAHTFNSVGEGGIELFNQSTSAFACFALVFLVIWKNQNGFVKVLEIPPMKLIGKYSYAMYIFHLPIMVVWFKYFMPDYNGMSEMRILLQVFLNYLIIFALTFSLAAVSWQVIEHPMLRLKRHFQT